MKRTSVRVLLTVAALTLASAVPARAFSQYKVIYTFLGKPDGEIPEAAMISDGSGNLYGTTEFGGSQKYGTVFKLAPGSGGTWTETVLYNFSDGTDGGQPRGRLVMDAAGNLYGTATVGGDPTCTPIHGYCGVVFRLSPNSDGTWTESVLVNFTGSNGLDPAAGMIFDGLGNLYGTAGGGAHGAGLVFELSPNSDGTYSESILYNFNKNEAGPNSDLVFDGSGNLYGTTGSGGDMSACSGFGCGTVFQLTQSGGTWTNQILHRFNGTDGASPVGVVFDSAGNLVGAAANGGAGNCSGLIVNGCGLIYRLIPSSGGHWQATILYEFGNHPAANPQQAIVDSSGNIYGTTLFGGVKSCDQRLETCGTIYKLAPPSGGGWTASGLYKFHGTSDGSFPYAALTMDSAGNLYGTTGSGGDLSCESSGGCGVVFQIIP